MKPKSAIPKINLVFKSLLLILPFLLLHYQQTYAGNVDIQIDANGTVTININKPGLGKLEFGHCSGGRLSLLFNVTGIKRGSDNLPIEYSLGQNYPNPTNTTTEISYTNLKPGEVTLIEEE